MGRVEDKHLGEDDSEIDGDKAGGSDLSESLLHTTGGVSKDSGCQNSWHRCRSSCLEWLVWRETATRTTKTMTLRNRKFGRLLRWQPLPVRSTHHCPPSSESEGEHNNGSGWLQQVDFRDTALAACARASR